MSSVRLVYPQEIAFWLNFLVDLFQVWILEPSLTQAAYEEVISIVDFQVTAEQRALAEDAADKLVALAIELTRAGAGMNTVDQAVEHGLALIGNIDRAVADQVGILIADARMRARV